MPTTAPTAPEAASLKATLQQMQAQIAKLRDDNARMKERLERAGKLKPASDGAAPTEKPKGNGHGQPPEAAAPAPAATAPEGESESMPGYLCAVCFHTWTPRTRTEAKCPKCGNEGEPQSPLTHDSQPEPDESKEDKEMRELRESIEERRRATPITPPPAGPNAKAEALAATEAAKAAQLEAERATYEAHEANEAAYEEVVKKGSAPGSDAVKAAHERAKAARDKADRAEAGAHLARSRANYANWIANQPPSDAPVEAAPTPAPAPAPVEPSGPSAVDKLFAQTVTSQADHDALWELARQAQSEYDNLDDAEKVRQADRAVMRLDCEYAPDDPEYRVNVVEAINALGANRCETCGNFVTGDNAAGHKPGCGIGQAAREARYRPPEIKPLKEGLTFTPQAAGDFGEVGGAKTRLRNNIAAIELLKKLEAEGRAATPEEQAVMAKFVSWGGLPQVFDQANQLMTSADLLKKLEADGETLDSCRWQDLTRRFNPEQRQKVNTYLWDQRRIRALDRVTASQWDDFKAWLDAQKTEWSDEARAVRELMTEDEWKDAARSITNAHYTSREVAALIWEGAQQVGFEGGRILEPAVGKGVFPMTMPPEMAARSQVVGVDRDSLSARIARQLCQQADIRENDYQSAALPKNFFHAAVSNVPFGQIPVYDQEFAKNGVNAMLNDARYECANCGHVFEPRPGSKGEPARCPECRTQVPDRPDAHLPSVHNYYFAKALDQVQPGGLIAFVTSRYTLDAAGADGVRKYLAGQADLLGAVRLPNTAFKGNAGTEVTTDVLYLRKRMPGEAPGDQSWTELAPMVGADGKALNINRYYVEHPDMMLGKMESSGTMGHAKGQPQLVSDGRDLGEALREAVHKLPKDALKKRPAFNCHSCGNFIGEDGLGHKPTCSMIASVFAAPALGQVDAYDREMKIGDDGRVYRKSGGEWKLHALHATLNKDGSEPLELQKIRAYLKLKTAMLEVITANKDNLSDDELQAAQQKLNEAYDAFVGRFGPINVPANQRVLKGEPYRARLMAIEVYDSATNEAQRDPAFFYKRLGRPPVYADHADTVAEALLISMGELGEMDFERMAQLMPGRTVESLQAELLNEGLAYPTPDGWQAAEEYLSGNVRVKLAEARRLAELDPAYLAHVKALEAVQPRDLLPSEIDVAPGQAWIPREDVSEFANTLLKGNFGVEFMPATATWKLKGRFNPDSVENTQLYGTHRMPANEILERLLNGAEIRVFDKDENDKRILNRDETLAAQQKAAEIKKRFGAFMLLDDPARAERLARLYNETMNAEVPREYRHPGLKLPGMSMEIPPLYDSQKNAIWRIMQGKNTGLFHSVGFGKTFSAIGAGMELRRIGRRKKVMHCVPNNMLKQYTTDIYRMYPGARVLSLSSKMIEEAPGSSSEEKRNYVMARIAQGDWDAVVVTHSAFGKIPLSASTEAALTKERIVEYEAALREAQANDENLTEKDIQKSLDGYTEKLKAQQARINAGKDSAIVTWEDLGVDQLFVDEADMFKNLNFPTRKNIPGVKGRASQRAEDMFNKIRAMQARCPKCQKFVNADDRVCRNCLTEKPDNSAAVCFMTGTPIANTVSEMYIMQRYLDYDGLKRDGLEAFDTWAAQFGEEVTALEMKPSGKGYRMCTRFSKYKNLPELKRKFWRFADIQQDAEKVGVKKPRLTAGKPRAISAKSTPSLQALVDDLADRADHLSGVDPDVDNMLKITGDGRTAAIDLRLRAGLMGEILTKLEEEHKANAWQAAIDNAKYSLKRAQAELKNVNQGNPDEVKRAKDEARRAQQALTEAIKDKPRKEAQLADLQRLKMLGWDEPNSKVNLALRDIAQKVEQTTGVLVPNLRGDLELEGPQNLAVMVFCDVGTPQKGEGKKGKKKGKKGKDGKQAVPAESNFDLYQDMKDKLTRGVRVPQADGTEKVVKLKPEEIAFAHDYDSDDKKLELTNLVNAGKIRVVIGSTSKLGAGTNAQRRLAMEVHLDAPWRPRDVEQREGRIARTGNQSWVPDDTGSNSRRCATCGNFIDSKGSGHKKECGQPAIESAPWVTEGYDTLPGHEKAARQLAWFNATAAPALAAWQAWQPIGAEVAKRREEAAALAAQLELKENPANRAKLARLESQLAGLLPREAELLTALRAEQDKRTVQFEKWAKPQPEIRRYVTEESFDVYTWQGLERKQTFIVQGLNKDLTQRRIDETDALVLSASEVKALATGDPRIIERTGLEHDLETLERQAGAFSDEQHQARRQLTDLPERLADTQANVTKWEKISGAVEAARKKDAEQTAALTVELEQKREQEKQAREALHTAKEAVEKAEKAAKKAEAETSPELQAAQATAAEAEQAHTAIKDTVARLRARVEEEGGFKLTLNNRGIIYSRKSASAALVDLENRLQEEKNNTWRPMGDYMGFPLMARQMGYGIQIGLDVGDKELLTIADTQSSKWRAFDSDNDSGAHADRLKKALEVAGDRLQYYQREQANLKTRAAPLQAILEQKFEHAAVLEQKRARYQELMAEFDAEDAAVQQYMEPATDDEAPEEKEVEEEE